MSRNYTSAYRRRRKYVLTRDGRCQAVECAEARPDRLTVHHKRPLSEGGNHKVKNLVALCWLHHSLLHRNYQG